MQNQKQATFSVKTKLWGCCTKFKHAKEQKFCILIGALLRINHTHPLRKFALLFFAILLLKALRAERFLRTLLQTPCEANFSSFKVSHRLSIFRQLSWELERLAKVENEFKDTYMELSTQCKRYSCELLDQCRSSEEVIAVLNRQTSPAEPSMYDEAPFESERLSLDRLKLALKYEQKQVRPQIFTLKISYRNYRFHCCHNNSFNCSVDIFWIILW